ncbi:GBS Bsp-like repeat-containing protein, partial [Erysipelatoclostridium ramosum]
NESGQYITHIYATNASGKQGVANINNIEVPNSAPKIKSIKKKEVTNESYTLEIIADDDNKVVQVKAVTWTNDNGQDDLLWTDATYENGKWIVKIDRKDHNFRYGDYTTHVYAYDAEGIYTSVDSGKNVIEEPDFSDNKPHIKDVYITEANDFGFTITCTVTDDNAIKKVQMPTWTYFGGQDDLKWYTATKVDKNTYSYRVMKSDHNSEFGAYMTHIYAYDVDGNFTVINLNYHNIINTTVSKGWTYLNGQKYFFDNAGNIAGNMPAKKVIDVSSYNETIDWDTVKRYGDIDGAILRITAHPNGNYIEDKQFANNLANCRRLGIPFGVYIYDYANNTTDAANEAEFVVSILRKYNVTPNELAYPVFYDLERETLTTQQNVDHVNVFISAMDRYGYNAKVYSYRSMLQSVLNHPSILAHASWLAAYTNTMGWSNSYYHGDFGWQYTSGGTVPGISGYVDISCWFKV